MSIEKTKNSNTVKDLDRELEAARYADQTESELAEIYKKIELCYEELGECVEELKRLNPEIAAAIKEAKSNDIIFDRF